MTRIDTEKESNPHLRRIIMDAAVWHKKLEDLAELRRAASASRLEGTFAESGQANH
jgi:hypothetical protein